MVAARGGAPLSVRRRWSPAGSLAGVRDQRARSSRQWTRSRRSVERSEPAGDSRCPRASAAVGARLPSSTPSPVPGASLSTYTAALREMTVCSTLEGERQRLIRRIEGIDGARGPEHLATEAVVAVRSFQEAAWNQAQAEINALRQEADQDLAALKSVLTPQALATAVEEVCRDIVRRRTPLVSASAVWDRVTTS